MKVTISILLIICCCSCATYRTIAPLNNNVKISYNGHDSYCEKIPRIYSGVSYNVCLFYGEPNLNPNTEIPTLHGYPYVVNDMFWSTLADTLLLPYSVSMQIMHGNIKVNQPRY